MNNLFIAALLLGLVGWIPQGVTKRTANRDYIAEVLKAREQRDSDYRDPKKSDLDPADIPGFKGLPYFAVNPVYKVTAAFVRTPDEKKFQMPTMDGKFKTHLKYGELHFKLAGKALSLAVYQSEKLLQTEEYKDYLLVPFKDLTCGKESYKGGRYIDFRIPEKSEVSLDFNLAYNPSCAYATRFSCPVVPRVNDLNIAVRAGEKAYRGKAGH